MTVELGQIQIQMLSVGLAAGSLGRGGLDLVDRQRLQTAIARSGEPLVARVFGTGRDRPAGFEHRAVVFGAKEASIKAIGGLPAGGRFTDIDVVVGHPAGPGPGRVAATIRGPAAGPAGCGEPGGSGGPVVLTGGHTDLGHGTTLVWLLEAEAR